MANFAIHDEVTVVNVIVADSQEIAKEVTGMAAFQTNGAPWVGWTFVDGAWVAPSEPEPESPLTVTNIPPTLNTVFVEGTNE